MDVDHAQTRKIKQGLRQNFAVGGHNAKIDTPASQRLEKRGIGDPRWLKNRQVVVECEPFDGTFGEVLTAAAGPIGLCHDTDKDVVRSEQMFQSRNGKSWRSDERDPQWWQTVWHEIALTRFRL
jgi:hypothetical protein